MKPWIHTFLLMLALPMSVCAQPSTTNKPGCSLIEAKHQSQYVTFEKLEDSEASNQHRQMVVLRVRNNTNCDITLLAWEHGPQRIAIVKGPNRKNRIAYTTDFPDGSLIDNLKYIIQLQEPPPPVNKRKKLVATDEVLDYFVLKAGYSALFKVPFERFEKWITVELPFYYSWDLEANANRVYHRAYFGNLDLPDDVFKRTKVCRTLSSCK